MRPIVNGLLFVDIARTEACSGRRQPPHGERGDRDDCAGGAMRAVRRLCLPVLAGLPVLFMAGPTAAQPVPVIGQEDPGAAVVPTVTPRPAGSVPPTVALPRVPAPPRGVPPAAGATGVPADLAARLTALEEERRWSDLVALCEPLMRHGNLPAECLDRYDLARIHCDLVRRHSESAFRGRLATLSEADGRRLHRDVLSRIRTHHVDAPDVHRLTLRGLRAMDVAVEHPLFISLWAPQADDARRGAYREQVGRLVAGRTVTTQAEAETVVAWAARIGHATLGIPPAVTLLEITAATMGGLDEYSTFLTNGQLDDLYAQIEGNFVGLGVELKTAPDGLLVVDVITGSPAERGGLRGGDHIVAIDGRSIGGLSVDESAQLLQGPEGSTVVLEVTRGGAAASRVQLQREHVEVPSVEDVRMIDPAAGIAHVKLSSFQKTTAADLEGALRRLDAAGMRSLVIDLRGNPGGLLSAAVDVADLFLERGLVVATRGRSPEEDFNYSATRAGTWRMPIVVLIDGDSASSSEIFAGAIRDHGRGTIVGSRSFGKGSIQGIFPLDVGGVGLRLTTAKFFSPKGRPYARVGVEPDLPVQVAARPASPPEPREGLAVALEPEVGDAPADAALEAAVAAARRGLERRVPRASARAQVSR